MIDISIVIVSWNSKNYLSECLSSLAAGAGSLSFETFVVDNASRDGSADLVRGKFPWVRLISNAANRGFASANNQALKISIGRYALLLNPDTRVHPRAIEGVVGFMDRHPEAGACGCLLLNQDGSAQHAVRRFPTFAFALGAKTILGRMGLFRRGYESVKMRGEHFDAVMEVDQPSGAALFLRQNVLARVGLLDEHYFMFFEEVDLCRRIKNAGHRIYLFPDASITHYGGRSRRQSRAEVILPGLQSMLRYFRTHEGPIRSGLFELVFRPLFAIGICFDAGRAALRISISRLRPHRGGAMAEKEARLRAYCAFIKRDLIKFLTTPWE